MTSKYTQGHTDTDTHTHIHTGRHNSTTLAIREVKIKIALKFILKPLGMTIFETTRTICGGYKTKNSYMV